MSAPSLGLTSYSEQAVGYPGMIADLSDGHVIESARNAEASLSLPFGIAVIRSTDALTPGTAIKNVVKPATSGDRIYGVIVHSHDYDNGPNGTLDTVGLKPDATVNVMRRGLLLVNTEDSCTEGNAAFVRYTANTALPGELRSDGDSSKAVECTGIVWRTTRTDSGLAVVEIDMPTYDGQKNV